MTGDENKNSIEAELELLKKENKKLARELSNMQSIFDRNKLIVGAQSNMRAVITANKSKQEKYLELLLSNCPDIIMLFDHYGRFAYCTDTFLDEAGIAAFGLINGRTYQEVFARFTEDAFIKRIESAIAKTSSDRKTVLLNESVDFGGKGNLRDYSIQIASMKDENGRISGTLALFHDLTDLLSAKKQAEHANSAKSDFLTTMSHEIRTPLNAIIGIADIMKQTHLDAQQRQNMRNITNSSHILLDIINDILDFSKIEAGKLELVIDYFDLPLMLNKIKAIFKVMFDQKKLKFICRFADNLPHIVLGDEKRIAQILTNLLNNSLKYTNEGHVIFAARFDENNKITFEVEDTGIGIKPEDMPRLFKAFEQFDKVKNKKITGTGLGLAITKRLCDLMCGSVKAESVYGAGSHFSVCVKLEVGKKGDIKKERVPVYNFTAEKAKVLLVDDIEINLVVAKAMLKSYGIVPDTALDGAEAIRKVKEKDYDLIFMDHMMPEMDGIEATKKIREMGGKYETVPIVALTANAVNGAEAMFLKNGFNGFLSKPMDLHALAASLFEWLPKNIIKEHKV